MSVLAIGKAERERIKIAVETARAKPTPWSVLEEVALADEGPTLNLDERKNSERIEQIRREYPTQEMQLGTYSVAFSFEEQPAGLFRHLSVSSHERSKIPNQAVMEVICETFGFSDFPPIRAHRVWLEEFAPQHHALNVVELEP